MPTINQLIRKGREAKGRSQILQRLTKDLTASKKPKQMYLHHKNVEYVHVLVQ